MATSDDHEFVSLIKFLSSGEEVEEEFQSVLRPSNTNRRGFTYKPNWTTNHPLEKSHHVFKKHKLYLPTLCFFAIGLTIWIFTLTWVAVKLRIEMQRLTNISNKGISAMGFIIIVDCWLITIPCQEMMKQCCEMESGRGHGGVMRGGPGGKKMRKRKELDALVGGVGVKRANGGNKRPGSGGVSPQDQLLSESTGEEEYWSSAKGGGCGKGRRHYSSHNGKRHARACTALLRLCTILLVMACVVATITVMWLFIDIKEQTTYLRSQLDQVSAGNEAIPDAIQQCHSLTRQLEKNQTKIIDQMQQVAQRLTNFSNMISNIQVGLSNVEKKLNDSPELVTTPTTLRSLMSSIAIIGGQLNDFNITTAKISNEQKKILEQIDGIIRNLTLVNEDVQDLRDNSFYKPIVPNQNNTAIIAQEVIEKISPNLTLINNTLSNRIHWILEDQNNSQKNINELKDDYEYCKSQIMTIKDDQLNHNKVIKDITIDTAQIKKDMTDYKTTVDFSEAYIKNISMQLFSCTEACRNNSTSTVPVTNTSTIPPLKVEK